MSFENNESLVFEDFFVNERTIEDTLKKAKEVFQVLVEKTSLDGFEIINSDVSSCNCTFSNSSSVLKFVNLNNERFSLVADENGYCKFSIDYDDMDDYLNTFNSQEWLAMYNSLLDLDNEEISFFSGVNKTSLYEDTQEVSIVPDGISEIILLALVLDEKVVAYRFKTNMGYFDITKSKAMEYGVSGYKIEKAIKLQRYNGMLVSKSEIKNKRCIPDISNCDEDCRKLFDALFN